MAAKCLYCNKEIDADRDFQLVTGYVSRRSGGGANTIAMKEPVRPAVWVCWAHMNDLKAGRTPGQGTLI